MAARMTIAQIHLQSFVCFSSRSMRDCAPRSSLCVRSMPPSMSSSRWFCARARVRAAGAESGAGDEA